MSGTTVQDEKTILEIETLRRSIKELLKTKIPPRIPYSSYPRIPFIRGYEVWPLDPNPEPWDEIYARRSRFWYGADGRLYEIELVPFTVQQYTIRRMQKGRLEFYASQNVGQAHNRYARKLLRELIIFEKELSAQ